MQNINVCPGSRMLQNIAHVSRFTCIYVLLIMMAGCNDNNDTSVPTSTPTAQAVGDDGFLSTMTAALSEGQFTVNNYWGDAEFQEYLVENNVYTFFSHPYGDEAAPSGRVRPFTTLLQQYRAKRAQCEKDAQDVHYSNGEPSCYTTNQEAVIAINSRYGYYCGYNLPRGLGAFWDAMPEPLDGVDYCCRLHDEKVWSKAGGSNECGIAMCLRQASGLPANVMQLLPQVEEARQYWYKWASVICTGVNPADAPPPTVGP